MKRLAILLMFLPLLLFNYSCSEDDADTVEKAITNSKSITDSLFISRWEAATTYLVLNDDKTGEEGNHMVGFSDEKTADVTWEITTIEVSAMDTATFEMVYSEVPGLKVTDEDGYYTELQIIIDGETIKLKDNDNNLTYTIAGPISKEENNEGDNQDVVVEGVSDIVVDEVGEDYVVISWTNPASLSWVVIYDEEKTETNNYVANSNSSEYHSKKITGLSKGEYTFYLYVRDLNASSDRSAQFSEAVTITVTVGTTEEETNFTLSGTDWKYTGANAMKLMFSSSAQTVTYWGGVGSNYPDRFYGLKYTFDYETLKGEITSGELRGTKFTVSSTHKSLNCLSSKFDRTK